MILFTKNNMPLRIKNHATIALVFLGFSICGCFKLDMFLWKPNPAEAYKFDKYTGETECSDAIDSLVKWYGPVDTDTIYEQTFESRGKSIWSVLVARSPVLHNSDTLLFYFYGRSSNIDFYWPRIRLLAATGFAVFTIDFPGYGKSEGECGEEELYAAAHSAMSYIRTELGDPAVIVYGYSTGTWAACELASSDTGGKLKRLILEAPYNSMETLVQDAVYLNIPSTYVTLLEGDCGEKIKNATIPFLWIHGVEDQTLSRETQGRPVWENYGGDTAYYIAVEGSDHAEVPSVLGYRRYIECIKSFIRGNPEDSAFVSK